jgi:hypothetical protein
VVPAPDREAPAPVEASSATESAADAEEADEESPPEQVEDDWSARDRRRWKLVARVDELAGEVQAMVQRGEWEAAQSAATEAVAAARAIEIDDTIKDNALAQAARIVAGAGDVAAGVELLGEVGEFMRAEALDWLARSYAEVGAHDHAMYVWLCGFADLRRTSRRLVLRALQTATWLIEDDEVLWRLCQAVLEVERWWEPPTARVVDPNTKGA